MKSRKTTALADVPLSGDKLIDWIFKQFVFFLRRETLRIKRRKRLRNAPKSQVLLGLLEIDTGPDGRRTEISINSAKSRHCNRDEEVSTLIHELSHIVFWKTQERFISQIERVLTDKFTIEQKNYLKSFIPRHEVKSA